MVNWSARTQETEASPEFMPLRGILFAACLMVPFWIAVGLAIALV